MEMRVDIHQHIWTRPLLDQLAAREKMPLVRRSDGLTVLHSAAEQPYVIDVAAEMPGQRATLVWGDGLDLAVIAISSPVGIEALPRENALELIDAHLAGVGALPEMFAAPACGRGARPAPAAARERQRVRRRRQLPGVRGSLRSRRGLLRPVCHPDHRAVISSLRSIRLTPVQLAIVAGLSGLATSLIIASALGRSAAQEAAIAALHHKRTVVEPAAARPAASPAAGSTDPASAGMPTSAPAPAPAGAQAASGATGSGGGGAATGTTTSTTTTTQTSSTTSSAPSEKTHKVGHVFVIALSTTSFEAAFGQSSVAHYLNGTLRREGTFLGGYETLGRAELPDYLAMVSGQAPNADTMGECSTYAEFPTNPNPLADGQVPGIGCVYPNTIITLADQVTAAGHVWKGYIDDMGKSTCVHPNSDAVDAGQLPGAGRQYATRHNPFIYFHSLLDLGGCSSDDVSLNQLPGDLRSATNTPSYAFIAPSACDDASASTCANGAAAGLAGEDAFLRQWVPPILSSAAYKRNGVLIITFALTGTAGPGGPVPTGALVLSPFAARGKTISTTYDPYSVLRTVEELFGYDLLSHAKSAQSFETAALPGA